MSGPVTFVKVDFCIFMVYDLPDGFLHSKGIGSMTPSPLFSHLHEICFWFVAGAFYFYVYLLIASLTTSLFKSMSPKHGNVRSGDFCESRFLHLHGARFTRWFSTFKSHWLNDPLPLVFRIFMRSVSGLLQQPFICISFLGDCFSDHFSL